MPEGFYWVRWNGMTEVANFVGGRFWFCGNEESVSASEVEVVSGKLLPPADAE